MPINNPLLNNAQISKIICAVAWMQGTSGNVPSEASKFPSCVMFYGSSVNLLWFLLTGDYPDRDGQEWALSHLIFSEGITLSCRVFGWSDSWGGYITDANRHFVFPCGKQTISHEEMATPKTLIFEKNSSAFFLDSCFYTSVLLYHFCLATVSSVFSSEEFRIMNRYFLNYQLLWTSRR